MLIENEDLKIIENELVPVYETSTGEKVVYGTELHTTLRVKSKFADWIKNRLNDCEAAENEDFQTFSKILEKGRPSIDYIIKLDTAKEMAMLERNEKGKQVRRYFIRIEKKYKARGHQEPAQNPIQELSPQLQFMITMELKQKALEEKVQQQEETIQSIRDALTDEVKDYRRWVTKAIGQIAQSSSFGGGPLGYQRAWLESYDRLFEKYPCALDVMIKDAKEVAQKAGKSKTEIKGINKQTVIAGNEFLRNHYITVIKEMLVAYCAGVA